MPFQILGQAARAAAVPASRAGRSAALITLGCAKNQVDSEVMLGLLARAGYRIVHDPEEAEVVVVNTCGFLQSAVKESVDCILEAARLRKTGRLRKLIVAGCLVERYRQELLPALPEVDLFLKVDEIPRIAQFASLESQGGASGDAGRSDYKGRPVFLYDDKIPRAPQSGQASAYVKVSDGCNHTCSFCIIPALRGRHRSRDPQSVLREVRQLGAIGVREVNLIAQDLTAYGSDLNLGRRQGLAALLKALDKDGAVEWVRLLYAYPTGVTETLLDTILGCGRICNYLDIPLQHVSESVLSRMNRPLGRYAPRRLVEFIRARAPQLKLRTTFIVGFPGETEADLKELESFVSEGHFASVGVFTYSAEQGTKAFELAPDIRQPKKDARRSRILRAQRAVVKRELLAYRGQVLQVLVEGAHQESDLLMSGRTEFQAPDVDGTVIINDLDEGAKLSPGSIQPIEITGVAGYDLLGKVLGA